MEAIDGGTDSLAGRQEDGDVATGPRATGPPAGPPAEHAPANATVGRVLVLNASYEPLNVCTVRRAVVLILKEKAELLERGERRLRSESMHVPAPRRDPAGHLRAGAARLAPGGASPGARCSPATRGPASTAARRRT